MRECPRCEICYNDDVVTCPTDATATKVTMPGTTLLSGRYLLEKRLGRGAMGQVYLAKDQNLLTRKVAVKTVRPDLLSNEDMQEGEAIARFEREARTAASIRHPHVVDVTDFGKSPEGIFFLVMEFVEGESLHQLLRREGTLSIPRAVGLLREICDGVEAAHEAGILHRDLKPANIFIMQRKRKSATGVGDGFVKVGDFGLAKIVSDTVSEIDSASGPASRGIIGTPEFMAPEQMQPGTPLDARADIYAIGTIAYLMLGGRAPFTGDLMQLIMQKMMQSPPPLSSLRSDIPPKVAQVVMMALEREPSARPLNVLEWIDKLKEAAEGIQEGKTAKESRLVVLAPVGAEVYVDDERKGNVGSSGRIILKSVPPGRHVLRVARVGERDDERVIEIRPDGNEQVIQAQLKSQPSPSQITPSHGSGGTSGPHSSIPGVIMCKQCGSRFAAGAKFCGRCGGSVFVPVVEAQQQPPQQGALSQPQPMNQQPPYQQTQQQPNQQPQQRSFYQQQPQQQPQQQQPLTSTPVATSNTILCPNCKNQSPAGIKFCGRCGFNFSMVQQSPPSHSQPSNLAQSSYPNAPQPQYTLCRKCGTNYPYGTKFCGRCGISLVGQ
jgi:serine/threonine-protein kinase